MHRASLEGLTNPPLHVDGESVRRKRTNRKLTSVYRRSHSRDCRMNVRLLTNEPLDSLTGRGVALPNRIWRAEKATSHAF
jgi:hypothetical protein